MLFKYLFSLFLSSIFLLSASFGQFEQQTRFLDVEEAYQLSVNLDTDNQLILNWQIAEGYYLYRHGFKVAVQTADTGEVVTHHEYIAAGIAKQDEFFGDVEVYYNSSEIRLSNLPAKQALKLKISSQGCADAGFCYPPHHEYFYFRPLQASILAIHSSDWQSPKSNISPTAQPNTDNTLSLKHYLWMLFSAILGGVILNLMPCVFPVLSLKVLSFTQDKQHNHGLQGISYTAGVVLSFIAVAALLISLQSAGEAIGWGFQLQSPWFVGALAYLFFIMGLSLAGYIELGSSLMGAGNTLSNRSGYSGSFFTGVLATVVASPCTAPFMGAALGFAITQPAFIALSIFAALGFGMALPLLVLSFSPRLLNKLPKPGNWMNKLKEFLAFPLFATSLWLCWVAGKQTGATGMLILLIGCLLISLGLWLWRSRQRLATLIFFILAFGLLFNPLFSQTDKGEQNWQTYSPERLSELRNKGQAVFINLTADWCITCLANEKVTLSQAAVKQSFIDYNVHYLKGDWTNPDPDIDALLKEHQRTGIPLYLYYPPEINAKAIILPQFLNAELLVDTFRQHSKPKREIL